MPERRRFPPQWSVEERPACFIINDAGGQAIAYVYYEEEPGRRTAAKLMTQDEARRDASLGSRPSRQANTREIVN